MKLQEALRRIEEVFKEGRVNYIHSYFGGLRKEKRGRRSNCF
jgi:hypothetical protein